MAHGRESELMVTFAFIMNLVKKSKIPPNQFSANVFNRRPRFQLYLEVTAGQAKIAVFMSDKL